jgi:hypothetical protein
MTGFWEALNSYTVPEVTPVEYRVYYNDSGKILFYTTEKPDGDYLIINYQEYAKGRYDLRVVKNQLVEPKLGTRKLVPGASGTITEVSDITIIATTGQQWQVKEYENDDEK